MSLQFVSNRALSQLRGGIETNRSAYLSGQAGTLLDSIDAAILESRIQADTPPKLEMPSEGQLRDSENVRRIYQWLNHLTPVQASDPRLWAYLTHGPYANYTAARWPIEATENVVDKVSDRYFVEGEGLRSLVHNSVARLWWFGYMSHDTEQSDMFVLTDVLVSLQDIQTAFLERTIGRSRRILHTALCLWKQRLENGGEIPKQGTVIQQWAKLLRLHGGVVLLDSLPDDQLQNLIWLKLGIALNEELPELEETA